MRRTMRGLSAIVGFASFVLVLGGSLPAQASPAAAPLQPDTTHACNQNVQPGYATCFALKRTDVKQPAVLAPNAAPSGLGPSDIKSAYKLGDGGSGQTVAIVDANDDPNAESDLAAYRKQFGLPECSTANGCFSKVNQNGNADPLPSPDPGWGLEISLDVDAVSATCPDCHILLIEAQSPNLNDLLTGVLTADALHVDAISNSYGSRGEFSGEQAGEPYLRALHSPAIFATGDYGYGNGRLLVGSISYPAASRYTIAVGGTSLIRDGSDRGWTETAWDGATSGCSAYIPKPSWQHDRLCDMRTDADISAVADPETGLAVRDTFGYDGWVQVGGTSLAAPIVSSLYAMRGGTADLRDLYHDQAAVFDAVGGSNGTNCSDTYLCTAVPGYDGPTGLGTPDASDSYWRS
jgi:subtilase family serine protease